MAPRILATLLRDAGRRLDAVPTQRLATHDLLLQGRALLLRPASINSRRQALRRYVQALAIEPGSIGARLGIVAALISNLSNGWSQAIEQDEERAAALLRDVFEKDTDVPIAHCLNGILLRLRGRLKDSGAELEMAMDLAPHYAMASSQLGMTLLYSGQPDAALTYFERGVRKGPEDPQRALLLNNLGTGYLLAGNTNSAIDQLRQAASGIPEHPSPPLALAAALALKSQSAAASAELRRAVDLCPGLGTLSGIRSWVRRQGAPEFMPVYEHTMERGLQHAGMPEA